MLIAPLNGRKKRVNTVPADSVDDSESEMSINMYPADISHPDERLEDGTPHYEDTLLQSSWVIDQQFHKTGTCTLQFSKSIKFL